MIYFFPLIGVVAGMLTGMTSVGGGLILSFILLLVPPLFGINYSMQEIAGMVMIQTIFSSASGVVSYWRSRLVDTFMLRYMGAPSVLGGLLGAVLSGQVSNELLTAIFAALSLVASAAMFMKRVSPSPDSSPYRSRLWAILAGFGFGILGGMFGLSAGFLYLPAMILGFKIDSRKAIGTSLAIGFLLVMGAILGKVTGSSLLWREGIFLACGAIPGALLGSRLGRRLNVKTLRTIIASAIVLIAVKLWTSLFVMTHLPH